MEGTNFTRTWAAFTSGIAAIAVSSAKTRASTTKLQRASVLGCISRFAWIQKFSRNVRASKPPQKQGAIKSLASL